MRRIWRDSDWIGNILSWPIPVSIPSPSYRTLVLQAFGEVEADLLDE